MDESFYVPAGNDRYVSTAATVGPWSADAQHGGPPSALAAWAMELHETDERQRLARVAIDILRPVPVSTITTRTRMVRPGRRVALLETVLEADGQEVLHARGWRIQRPAAEVPVVLDNGPLPPPVAGLFPSPPDIFTSQDMGYLNAIEWLFLDPEPDSPDAYRDSLPDWVAGEHEHEPDEPESEHPRITRGMAAWTRPRIPLLPDQPGSAMARTLLVADSGSGVSAVVPSNKFLFINVDLTVVLTRDPEGEWLLLDAATTVGADGTGLAVTRLSDTSGAVGRGMQTLLIAPR